MSSRSAPAASPLPALGLASALALAIAAPASAQVTRRVSVDSAGVGGDGSSGGGAEGKSVAISLGGRFVAFESLATNLVAGDTNGWRDVFVHDRLTGATSRASVATGGAQANLPSRFPSISADGRFVAFQSEATNLFAGDTNNHEDLFVRDRLLGTTERLGRGWWWPAISADGRSVAFVGLDALAASDTNVVEDVYVRDRQLGTTTHVSVSSAGVGGNQASTSTAISADGRYVAFASSATNLVPGDTNAAVDVFVHDRQAGTTERVSLDGAGAQVLHASFDPSISGDGSRVCFFSSSPDLVAGDGDTFFDVFVRDRLAGTIVRASVSSAGAEVDAPCDWSTISADGRFVAFTSTSGDLVPGDTNFDWDVFVRDLAAGTTERASVASDGSEGSWPSGQAAFPVMSYDGRYVAFDTWVGFAPPDPSFSLDVYVRDRDATGFAIFCEPGVAGAVACPCANPPSGPGRGCDNSSATGGATLAASGAAHLSGDTLVLATSGEKPTALSIVLQGTTAIASGAVYGQGVRCAGGTLKRLYTKSAVGGSVTAPDLGAGEPSVSARSAALGDPISPGQSRFVLVYYRDPLVLGGCPASSTFNATPTGRVDWTF